MPTSRHLEAGSRDGPRHRRRRALARAATLAGSVSLVVGLLGTAGAAATTSAGLGAAHLAVQSVSTTKFETAGCKAWDPPTAGVYFVLALGSAGQTVDGVAGGRGDQVSAEIAVTSSTDHFEVCVDSGGGKGGSGDGEPQTVGGNGGGASSLFYEASSGDYVPVVVAAGGGGAGGQGGSSSSGGNGGAAGQAGANGTGSVGSNGFRGGPGTSSSGGSGGAPAYSNSPPGDPGRSSILVGSSPSPGSGGAGSGGGSLSGGGGGGGGGYYGGGGGSGGTSGGGAGGGGGGGSDYCATDELSATLAMVHCFPPENVGASYGSYADGGSAEVSLRLMNKLASHLAFTAEPPSSTDVETPLAVTVTAETTDGAAVSTYRSPVSLSIASGPSAGTLSCPITGDTVTPTDGVATFHCLLNAAGTYTLQASSGGLRVATSTSIKVVTPPPPPPPPTPVTPAPVLSGIAPTSGPASGGTSITLSGTNLCAPTSVTFGSASATVVSVNATCTQVVVLDPAGTPASTVPVRLVNAGGTSNAESFTYASVALQAKASPVLTSVSPTRGLTSGGEDVTIDGANLCGVTAVDFGTAPATLVSTNAVCTEITVADPPGSGQVAVTLATPAGTATAPQRFDYVAPGYRLVGADGGVFDFGHSPYAGSLPGLGISVNDIVGMARDPGSGGYWLVGKDGGVFAFGGAPFLGSLPGLGISVHDITGIVAAPGGGGYWLVGADGGVFAFGDAPFLGSIPGLGISVHDITGIVAVPGGGGYWLVGKDGGIFSFGDAPYLGSLPGQGVHVDDITGIETTS